MSTRSNIGILHGDDSIDMIYCQWDGYPSNNGKLLLKHYSDTKKVKELLAMGDCSSLGPVIGTKHDFDDGDAREIQCTFYKRDRGGETGVSARRGLSIRKAMEEMQEYLYLWDAVRLKWFYSDHGENLKPLTKKDCKE